MRHIMFLVLLFVLNVPAYAATELFNADSLRKHFGLDAYKSTTALKNIKIAILDSGFQGYEAGSSLLPANTELVEKYDAQGTGNALDGSVTHGLYMAQIVWALTGKQTEGPKFYLLNANGITNLRHAVAFAIEKKIDIVLQSQNWEAGGNFDGGGFINQVVNQATSHGIIWINAAGNYGGKVFNGAVPAADRCLRFKSSYDKNRVSVFVSWNDFKDTEEYQTAKDLDFSVSDAKNGILFKGERAQSDLHDGREHSSHARELSVGIVDRGEYCIKIKKITSNFTDSDRVRVVVRSENLPHDSVDFLDHTNDGEIMSPADNSSVITVGNILASSASGPTRDGRTKPEIVLDTGEARFTDGAISNGDSNSAAFFAAIVSVLKASNAGLDRQAILNLVQNDVTKFLGEGVLRELNTYGGFLAKDDVIGIANEGARKVLTLRKDPIDLGYLFNKARTFANTNKIPSTAMRYFIIANPNAATNSPRVATYYFLPSDAAKELPTELNSWIELKLYDGDLKALNKLKSNWVTPNP